MSESESDLVNTFVQKCREMKITVALNVQNIKIKTDESGEHKGCSDGENKILDAFKQTCIRVHSNAVVFAVRVIESSKLYIDVSTVPLIDKIILYQMELFKFHKGRNHLRKPSPNRFYSELNLKSPICDQIVIYQLDVVDATLAELYSRVNYWVKRFNAIHMPHNSGMLLPSVRFARYCTKCFVCSASCESLGFDAGDHFSHPKGQQHIQSCIAAQCDKYKVELD